MDKLQDNKFIPVNEPLLDGNEKKYVTDCIETGWISSEGSYVRDFEEGMASYVGRKYGISVCNGSIALELAVEALGLKEGDEVIMPAFTIISCALPLVRRGIIPVLVDSESDTWNMNVNQIEERISSHTKAIMVVHLYGLPVDMDSVLKIAQRHGLKVIEDAAEAHGQEYKGKRCGSFGDISIFSFYSNKHITTGEGGMVLTDSDALAERCRSLRNLCFQPVQRFVHEEMGYNYRMSNIQAAIGCAQLERIEEHTAKKREIGKRYQEAFAGMEEWKLPLEKTAYAENIYWVFGMVLSPHIHSNAREIMEFLKVEGIGTRPFFWPMHMQPVFQKKGLFLGESYPIAEGLAQRGFYIPAGMGLSEEDQKKTIEKVKEATAWAAGR